MLPYLIYIADGILLATRYSVTVAVIFIFNLLISLMLCAAILCTFL